MKWIVTVIALFVSAVNFAQTESISIVQYTAGFAEEVSLKDFRDYNVETLFISKSEDAFNKNSIKYLPTIILYNDGEEEIRIEAGISLKLHFAAGSVIGAAGYVYSYNKHYNKKRAFINGVCTAFAAGVVKEIYDGENDGYVEHEDILATTLGGITITAILHLLNKNKKSNYRILDKKLGGYYYEKNYKEITYTDYNAFYELDIYTSYNTRQVKESKKR